MQTSCFNFSVNALEAVSSHFAILELNTFVYFFGRDFSSVRELSLNISRFDEMNKIQLSVLLEVRSYTGLCKFRPGFCI